MGFIMDGLTAEAYDRHYSDRALLNRILSYFRPQLRLMLFISAMVVLNSMMDAVLPILVAHGLDRLAEDKIKLDRDVLLLVLGILISGALSWVFNYVRQS